MPGSLDLPTLVFILVVALIVFGPAAFGGRLR
jgi:Sec-independent protein translocase protein TatA